MKGTLATALSSAILLAVWTGSVSAQSARAGTSDDGHAASGLVMKIEREPARATIQHGPVQTLGWPGMTMGFAVRDATILDRLQVGQRIDFEFVQDGKRYLIVRVK
ncbi:copper-binding protein [Zeimonas arvi]|jgi:Cu(I)/Ag(I) efflux system protein CusF|uniref:Copper-binding protein n=1 Tax=Zeimonas arvi TaxID=2498847 RepID=A0A5C8NRY6_9BURK|nr:copper-binding protein [Zeimonas arvi]TXL63897.1 copper-binding protein [Zeimonas arvi]